ncbi:MAG: hypothetical protein O2905_06520, partial [Proteobacteria bacterium]|nr:hypothetical protein [Pseudomonadota bacterium]
GMAEEVPLPDGIDGSAWPAPLAAMFRGDIGPGLAITAAPDGEADGHFFVGEFHLLGGNRQAAAEQFRRAIESGDESSHAFDCARAELERLAG